MSPFVARPDYLAIGHISKDLLAPPQGYAPGGTVLYSALTAQRLGLQAAAVTACAPEDDGLLDVLSDAGVWVYRKASPATTTFRNIYTPEGHRTQLIMAQAAPLLLDDVPTAWRDAPIVHLGPVAQELPEDMAGAFTNCLLGITSQGWLRSWNGDGRVRQSAAPIPSVLTSLPANAFLALSTEDLGYDIALVQQYSRLAPLIAVTQGSGDAYLCKQGNCQMVSAHPAQPIDPTGAGDVFAAALFVRYSETGDLIASARFAHAAAACNIEGSGPSAIPDRLTVEIRMGNR